MKWLLIAHKSKVDFHMYWYLNSQNKKICYFNFKNLKVPSVVVILLNHVSGSYNKFLFLSVSRCASMLYFIFMAGTMICPEDVISLRNNFKKIRRVIIFHKYSAKTTCTWHGLLLQQFLETLRCQQRAVSSNNFGCGT